MKRLFALALILVSLVACSNSKPTPPIAPSPIPAIAPTLVPSTMSSPQPVSTPDTSKWLPALDKTIDVGDVDLDTVYLQQPIAIDTQHMRLYVVTSVSHTLILDANTFAKIDEITIGGNLTLSSNRLFIGVPGAYASSGQQISRSELRAYDPQTLKLSPHIIYSDSSMLPAQVLVDDVRQKVYVVRSGVYEVDPATLRVIGTISGTVPSLDRLLPNYSAVDGAIDAARHRLVVTQAWCYAPARAATARVNAPSIPPRSATIAATSRTAMTATSRPYSVATEPSSSRRTVVAFT